MNVKLTDDAVAGLPLSHGRAELLEEIMRTPVLDERPVRTEKPKRQARWLVPIAAAAAIAMVATVPLWHDDRTEPVPVTSAPVETSGDFVLLEAPGWAVSSMYADGDSGEVTYENGGQSLEVMWGPTASYDGYVEDRRHIVEPPADGEPIEVLGADAQMWAYSVDDHTAIREVVDGRWIELRGSGMREPSYLALLGDLELVDQGTFEESLPEVFVTSSQREASIDEILDEIEAVAGTALPQGWTRGSIVSKQSDPYQLGAEVTGQVACAWIGQYVEAQRTGDPAASQQAVDVMATSRQWPVLHRMSRTGEWPEWLWQMADDLDAGRVPEGWDQTCQYGAP